MTALAQRIALAELDGWVKVNPPSDLPWGAPLEGKQWCFEHQLPDYLNDLNAVHGLEKKLTLGQLCDYGCELAHLSKAVTDGDAHWGVLAIAKAPQRCEALLRTLGKWDDLKQASRSTLASMTRYYTQRDGQWFQPKGKYRIACCHCGLVHRMEFRVVNGVIQFRAWRDHKATTLRRKRIGYKINTDSK